MSLQHGYTLEDFACFLGSPQNCLTQSVRKRAKLGYKHFFKEIQKKTDIRSIDIDETLRIFRGKNSKAKWPPDKLENQTIKDYERGLRTAIEKFLTSSTSDLSVGSQSLLEFAKETDVEVLTSTSKTAKTMHDDQLNVLVDQHVNNKIDSSKNALSAFLEVAADSQLISQSTASGWKTACRTLLNDMPLDTDVLRIDLDLITETLLEKKPDNLSPWTIEAYKKRVKAAIKCFNSWLECPKEHSNSSTGIGFTAIQNNKNSVLNDGKIFKDMQILSSEKGNAFVTTYESSVVPGFTVTIDICNGFKCDSLQLEKIYALAKKFVFEATYEHFYLMAKNQEGIE